jgi:uncharacterized protein involved in outer membrane biogenesis
MLLDVQSEDLQLGTLMAQLQQKPVAGGLLSTIIELQAEGNTPFEMVASLNGKVGVVLEEGKIRRDLMNLLAMDFLGWTVTQTVRRGAYADIDCGLGRFTLNQGVVNVDAFFLEGPVAAITGGGQIDLPAETLDVTLLPERKQRFFVSSPVRVRGDLRSPEVSAIPVRTASAEIAAFSLLPQIYLPAKALGFLFGLVASDEDEAKSPCFQLAAEIWDVSAEDAAKLPAIPQ